MTLHIDNDIEPMETPEIYDFHIQGYIKAMKAKTVPRPDGLKNEFYKALTKTEEGLQAVTRCMNAEITKQSKLLSWKCSVTKMIPKVAKMMAKQLRPIASQMCHTNCT